MEIFMEVNVKIKRVRDSAPLPKYATADAVGMDLVSCSDSPITIPAGKIAKIPTGIAVECERTDVAAFIFARSGLSTKRGVALANGVGVVDPDYRGEIFVSMINNSAEDYIVEPFERIAQIAFVPFLRARVVEAEELCDTARGDGGFGSTGKTFSD